MQIFKIQNFISVIVLLFITVIFVSCDDHDTPQVVLETGTVTDIDGNTYATVKIGNQWWMAEDLRATKFRSGSPVEKVDDETKWATATLPAYTIFQNSNIAPGFLYNYYTVNNGTENIAPEGWHVPTDDEWKELERHLGLAESEIESDNWRGIDQGDKLKIEGTDGWLFFDGVWGNNETGFSAFGGGSRFYEGPWGVPGLKGSAFWWTATENDGYGWYRYLDYKKSGIFRYFGNPNYGFSIRCIKDN